MVPIGSQCPETGGRGGVTWEKGRAQHVCKYDFTSQENRRPAFEQSQDPVGALGAEQPPKTRPLCVCCVLCRRVCTAQGRIPPGEGWERPAPGGAGWRCSRGGGGGEASLDCSAAIDPPPSEDPSGSVTLPPAGPLPPWRPPPLRGARSRRGRAALFLPGLGLLESSSY